MVCPHCGHLAHFSIDHQQRVYATACPQNVTAVGYMTCAHCGMPVTLAADESGTVIHKWPLVTSGRDYPDVPNDISAMASEAHRCLEAMAPRAAATMARAVVEAIAKDKGIASGSLMGKIDTLAESGHISESMKEAAHEIRFAGNAAAHSDLVRYSGDQGDAEEIVELMAAILDRVYREPAQVARVRARREAREQGKEVPNDLTRTAIPQRIYLSTVADPPF